MASGSSLSRKSATYRESVLSNKALEPKKSKVGLLTIKQKATKKSTVTLYNGINMERIKQEAKQTVMLQKQACNAKPT